VRYHVRQRGKDESIGPFTTEEIVSRVKIGQLNPWDMVLIDGGQTPEQLKNHWNFKWQPLEGLLSAARLAKSVTSVSRNSAMEEHLQARAEKKLCR